MSFLTKDHDIYTEIFFFFCQSVSVRALPSLPVCTTARGAMTNADVVLNGRPSAEDQPRSPVSSVFVGDNGERRIRFN